MGFSWRAGRPARALEIADVEIVGSAGGTAGISIATATAAIVRLHAEECRVAEESTCPHRLALSTRSRLRAAMSAASKNVGAISLRLTKSSTAWSTSGFRLAYFRDMNPPYSPTMPHNATRISDGFRDCASSNSQNLHVR